MWNTIIFGWLYFFGLMATAAAVSDQSRRYPWGVFFVATFWPLVVPLSMVLAICTVLYVRGWGRR